jgi:ATP-dependent helicase/nuclease subunit B
MRLLSTRNNSDLNRSLLAEAETRVGVGDFSSFVILVPTRGRAREVLASLVQKAPSRALGGVSILTIQDFATGLLRVLAPGVRVIGDSEMAVFLELAIKELQTAKRLDYFGLRDQGEGAARHQRSLPMPRGTFETLLNSIRALKENAVTPSMLEEEMQESQRRHGESTELNRAKDIHAIFEAYEQSLGQNLTDGYGQLTLVERILQTAQGQASSLGDGSLKEWELSFGALTEIFLDSFLRLERSSLRFLHSLRSVDRIRMSIELPEGLANRALFRSLHTLEATLREYGFDFTKELVPTTAPSGDQTDKVRRFVDHIGGFLFNPEKRSEVLLDCSTVVHFSSATSREAEVEQIVRQIKILFETDPNIRTEPSRICIAAPLEREYALLFRAAFARHGIPASVTDRYKLDTAGITAGVIAFLEMVDGGLNRRNLVRALSTPYLELRDERGVPIDALNLKYVAEREQLIGTSEDWEAKLTERLRQLDDQLSEAGLDPFDVRNLEQLRHGFEKARQDIHSFGAIIAHFERPLKPAEFRSHLFHFFRSVAIRKNLLRDDEALISIGALEHETRSYGTLVKVVEELMVLCDSLGVSEEALPVDFYLERFRTASSIARFTPRFDPGSVFVTSLDQFHGVNCDYLFIPGMVDGRFPSRYEPQIFLLWSQQKGEDRQRDEERLLFFEALNKFTRSVYLSWPEKDEDAAETTRSSFLDAIEAVVTVDHVGGEVQFLSSSRDLYSYVGSRVAKGAAIKTTLEALVIEVQTERYNTLREHVPIALQAQQFRLHAAPSEFVGTIDLLHLSAEERARLQAFQGQVWSISQLETYAKCPFQFLVKNVLQLSTPELFEEGLDPAERGSLIHRILYDLFTERRDLGMTPVQDVESEMQRSEFHEQAKRIVSTRTADSLNAHPFHRLDTEVELGGSVDGDSLFEKLLKVESKLKDSQLKPAYFEVSFGMKGAVLTGADGALSRNEPIPVSDKLKLRGKIDRIDMDAGNFSIVDYKTGSGAKRKEMESGMSLQLPLYLKSAERLFSERAATLVPVAGVYQLVRKGARELGIALKEYSGVTGKKPKAGNQGILENDEELRALIDASILHAESYVRGVVEGRFPLVAEENVSKICPHCDFRSACRQREAIKNGTLRSIESH